MEPAQSTRGNLVAVAGPSGVGKSTIVRAAADQAHNIWLSVSATTRTPRPGERDGIDYLFLSQPEFAALRDGGGLIEWAKYSDNFYGTPKAPVQRQLAAGRHVLLEIDVQGVRQIKAEMPACRTVFIAPPSWETLRDRLTARGTEDEAGLARRLATAKQELMAIDEFDLVIVNAEIEVACAQLLAWVDNPPD